MPRGGGGQARDVQVSKALSRLLRHAAVDEGVPIDKHGYVRMDDLLAWKRLKGLKVGFEEVVEVVQGNAKKRFAMKWAERGGVGKVVGGGDGEVQAEQAEQVEDGETARAVAAFGEGSDRDPTRYFIRATQGHSMKAVESEGLLEPITLSDPAGVPETVVHGTFYGTWEVILRSGGLKKMGRNHVHFATGPGLNEVLPGQGNGDGLGETAIGHVLGENKVISGMRGDAQILVYVDIKKALLVGGWEWWKSENGVVLTEGVMGEGMDDKMVPMEYWDVVVEVKEGLGVLWRKGEGVVKELPQNLRARGVPRGKGGGPRGRGRGRGGGRGAGKPKLMVEGDKAAEDA